MAARYQKDVAFLLVYIREAHPVDGRQAPANIRDGVILQSATTQAEREDHADTCVRSLNIRFPTVVDKLDNKVELAYSGWPDRLYLIGTDGRVIFKSAPGPAGFRPSLLESAITRALKR